MRTLGLASWCWLVAAAVQAAPPAVHFDDAHRAFFRDYCVACHGPELQEANLRLDDISLTIETVEHADRWQKILNALNSGEMPPEDAAPPDRRRKTEFLDALSQTMVAARKALSDQGGRITLRRLNQREYRNTIRDLLGVELDVRELPGDGGTGAFDTVGASLYMSGDQIEQYLALGRRALDEYFVRDAAGSQTFRAREEAEITGNKKMDELFERARDNHEQYRRWAEAVDAAAARPENLQLAAELREQVKKPQPSSGVPYATPLLFYHHWDEIAGAPPPSDFGFPDAQKAFFEELLYEKHYNYFADYRELPGRETGAWLLFYRAYRETYVSAEPKWPNGRYLLRMRVAGNSAAPSERRFVEVGQRGDDVSDFTVSSAHQVTGTLDEPQVIEVPVDLLPGQKRQFALREKRPNSQLAEIRTYYDEFEKSGHGPVPAVWVDWFEIEGPIAPRQTPTVSLASPSQDEAGAREIIAKFTRRAFRGVMPKDDYLDRLTALFVERRQAGDSFEEAIKLPLSVVLASPGFLYLYEPSSEQGPRRLNDRELATRLAYFLWSGPPDEELLQLAAQERLREPAVLAAQVDRLLDDERSQQFASGFTHQWLALDRLDFFQFDWKLHRGFDDSTKAAARQEVYETMACLLRDDLRLQLLLKSDFVVVNGLLADYYGLHDVTGDGFRKVSLPADSPRGGLLGMAAILAMGSNGQYTSPVERGAWMLRKLLHDPPPPAPPNVPQLARLDGKLLDVRERLRAHQEEPQCASCHRKIDPLGFGLENFDAAGKWRTEDTFQARKGVAKTWPVQAAAAFYNGPSFADYFELRDLVAAREDDFARGFAEALIQYGLGRPFGFVDEELADDMLRRAKQRQFAVREFIQALAASDAFQSK